MVRLPIEYAESIGDESGIKRERAVKFRAGNADSPFNDTAIAFVFGRLAGPDSFAGFDWGLPFLFGRNVFTASRAKSTPDGSGPYCQYSISKAWGLI
jgi:hypothetical protein